VQRLRRGGMKPSEVLQQHRLADGSRRFGSSRLEFVGPKENLKGGRNAAGPKREVDRIDRIAVAKR
jgi:hypothetical protein